MVVGSKLLVLIDRLVNDPAEVVEFGKKRGVLIPILGEEVPGVRLVRTPID